jgi:hypothetical protein
MRSKEFAVGKLANRISEANQGAQKIGWAIPQVGNLSFTQWNLLMLEIRMLKVLMYSLLF